MTTSATKSTFGIKARLSAFNFIEFAVWGAYLTSLGAYLANIGQQSHIGWFYAIQGIVSIFMPALIGIIADRWVQAQRLLSYCHAIAGACMIFAWWYAVTAEPVEFGPLFTLYSISVAFFMPTIGLANSVAYSALNRAGLDTVKHFPPIRVFGTIGFICAMLTTNFCKLQNGPGQLLFSGCLSLVMMLYSLTMPACPVNKEKNGGGLAEALGLKAFKLFKDRQMAIFFLFSMFLGVSLQITNGFANPFIQSFKETAEFANSWCAENANFLISFSQMSETLCILLIPFFLKRYGIKIVMLMAMFAWVFRFGFFGLGNPDGGVWLFFLSMLVYGVAFDFFNVSGSLYVDQKTNADIRSSAQGLFMLMTNGLGATIGTLAAQYVVDALVYSHPAGIEQIEGWRTAWFIFAGYALVVGVLFAILFKDKDRSSSSQVKTIAEDEPGGMVGPE